MFIVMFEFVVKEGREDAFRRHWASTTQGIYCSCGSLGSRLHRNKNGEFIAYAQWPDRATWERASQIEMSPDYEAHRTAMRNNLDLERTRTLYEMEVDTDYLQVRPFAV